MASAFDEMFDKLQNSTYVKHNKMFSDSIDNFDVPATACAGISVRDKLCAMANTAYSLAYKVGISGSQKLEEMLF